MLGFYPFLVVIEVDQIEVDLFGDPSNPSVGYYTSGQVIARSLDEAEEKALASAKRLWDAKELINHAETEPRFRIDTSGMMYWWPFLRRRLGRWEPILSGGSWWPKYPRETSSQAGED